MPTRWTTLYKYVPLKYVEGILDNHRLYLSDGSNFNDPFELTVSERSTGNISRLSGLHILCLSNSFRNKLIWSHYTESHKGVCITVKVPNEIVYPICYSSQRVYTDSNIDRLIEKSTVCVKKSVKKPFSSLSDEKKTAYIKDKKWIYEREYRIVFDKGDESGLIHEDEKWFMSVKIENIYLGVNFLDNDAKTVNSILEACKRNGIKVTQMVLSQNDYSIGVMR